MENKMRQYFVYDEEFADRFTWLTYLSFKQRGEQNDALILKVININLTLSGVTQMERGRREGKNI